MRGSIPYKLKLAYPVLFEELSIVNTSFLTGELDR